MRVGVGGGGVGGGSVLSVAVLGLISLLFLGRQRRPLAQEGKPDAVFWKGNLAPRHSSLKGAPYEEIVNFYWNFKGHHGNDQKVFASVYFDKRQAWEVYLWVAQ